MSKETIYLLILIVVALLAFVIILVTRRKRQRTLASMSTGEGYQPNTQVYVGNLDYNIMEEEIRKHFDQYGNINQVKVVKDRRTGQSKGFGFVTFKSTAEADRALSANGKQFSGRKLVVKIAKVRD